MPCILPVMSEPQIVAMGGTPDDVLLEYVVAAARGKRVLYVPTAGMEDPAQTVSWYERLRARAELTHLHFFPWPPRELRRIALDHRSEEHTSELQSRREEVCR